MKNKFWILKEVLIIILLLQSTNVFGKRLYTEKQYQAKWCNSHGGQIEYQLKDGTRVDCLTDTLAVEFDFANKWAECIGQALNYGKRTGKTPACVLITENPEKDIKFVKRLRYAVYGKKKIYDFRTFTVKPDILNQGL